jgi:tRNA U34 2-thiouridine synthase MnmA/TrmU
MQYWTQVFEAFTEKFAMGLTPNPNLAYNQHVKVFDFSFLLSSMQLLLSNEISLRN